MRNVIVLPGKVNEIQGQEPQNAWIPAYAGMTTVLNLIYLCYQ